MNDFKKMMARSLFASIYDELSDAYKDLYELSECVDEETGEKIKKIANKINAFGSTKDYGIMQEFEEIKSSFNKL